MEEDIYLDKLDRRGIKPTAIRLLVIKAMMQAERAVSLLDLETLLDTVHRRWERLVEVCRLRQLLQLCGTGFTFAFLL